MQEASAETSNASYNDSEETNLIAINEMKQGTKVRVIVILIR